MKEEAFKAMQMLSEEENLKNVMNTTIEKLARNDLSEVERAGESFWFFGTYIEMKEKGLSIPPEAEFLNRRETAKQAVLFNVFYLHEEICQLMRQHERPGKYADPRIILYWYIFHEPFYDTLEDLFDPIKEWLTIAHWIGEHYGFGDEHIGEGIDYMIDELIQIRNEVEYCIAIRDGKVIFPDDDEPPSDLDDDDDDGDDGPPQDIFDPTGVQESSELVLV